MIILKTACAAGALLLASLASAYAAPGATAFAGVVPGTDGRWVYDGRTPPTCNARDIRVRHFEGDGHGSDSAEHAHLGHGHKWSKRNFKGYPTKPPCYVRRAAVQSAIQSNPIIAGTFAGTRNAMSGDLS